ncbi:MAG: multicopper oxidase domain-containing protein, partial [Actinobacteria bacterium]|nr:multicopper oxidase domain-containing protein [Actinomycetota bacterium]
MIRLVLRVVAAAMTVLAVTALGLVAWAWYESRLPGRYNIMDFGSADFGDGPTFPTEHSSGHRSVSVADLRGPQNGAPDVRVTLTAQKASVRLASGKLVEAWTFNGRVPGPPLQARKNQFVEVTLANRDIEDGVTIHWHGVNVPNAEDGVAGVTQDAVRPGGRYRYRFRVEQEGSYWYHSHQVGSEQVRPRALRRADLPSRRPVEANEPRCAGAHAQPGWCRRHRRQRPASAAHCRAGHVRSPAPREHGQRAEAVRARWSVLPRSGDRRRRSQRARTDPRASSRARWGWAVRRDLHHASD